MINNVCVCGAGTMGCGITQLAASSGLHVILYEVSRDVLEKGKKTIDWNLQLLVEKGKIAPGEREEIFQRIQFTNEPDNCVADIIIEAIVEDVDAKVDLFSRLAAINNEKVILTTNTSSLSVTAIAKEVPKPERFLGMHFFNPAPIMKLV